MTGAGASGRTLRTSESDYVSRQGGPGAGGKGYGGRVGSASAENRHRR